MRGFSVRDNRMGARDVASAIIIHDLFLRWSVWLGWCENGMSVEKQACLIESVEMQA